MPVLDNPKHELFAQAVAEGLNATDAYRRAGFTPHRQNAQRLMTNDDIKARVQELLQRGAERAEVTVERVVREMAKIGFSDIRKAVKWHGTLIREEEPSDGGDVLIVKSIVTNHVQIIDSDQIDDDTAGAISEVSQTKEGALKIKFHDKRAALLDLGKHVGAFVEQSEVKVVHDVRDEPLSLEEWAAQAEVPN